MTLGWVVVAVMVVGQNFKATHIQLYNSPSRMFKNDVHHIFVGHTSIAYLVIYYVMHITILHLSLPVGGVIAQFFLILLPAIFDMAMLLYVKRPKIGYIAISCIFLF